MIKQRQPGHPNVPSRSGTLLSLQQTCCPLPSLQIDLIEASSTTGVRHAHHIQRDETSNNDSSQTLLQRQLCPPLVHLCHHPDHYWLHPPCQVALLGAVCHLKTPEKTTSHLMTCNKDCIAVDCYLQMGRTIGSE